MSNLKDDIKVVTTQDGSHSLFSEQFGEFYHSRYGAIRESRHVFIEAGLFYKFGTGHSLSILEIGFGSGLNAFITYLETMSREKFIYYEAVEAFPVPVEEAEKLNFPELLGAMPEKEVFNLMHQLDWDLVHEISPKFSLKKSLKKFEQITDNEVFDLIYYDAFAPATQPELWEIPILSLMYNALKPGGIFVTYSAKGSVKRNLRSLGFVVEDLPGPPGKREMIRALK
ncbi:MAG: tRNA (5-methylaminomethyl-2-thiouridine)(34)-methyltransferase MnmD [Saprospiraceae bacterium]|nr:tRNA (5-methylaminomethyl-2-thiouridine)(34)-methyltransferase MnmD [Saprospiraceae bacterium]MCB9322378.1 tRNA (5-methylaminomethyl-2-thiouridine)(34)-methyltransferase MnmD [Lewinellaceae bacterium]